MLSSPEQISLDIHNAYENWEGMKPEFEHKGEAHLLPMLLCAEKFASFRNGYNVFRYDRAENVEKVRLFLNKPDTLQNAISSSKSSGLELLSIELQKKCSIRNREVSMLSKLAAFSFPDQFNAMDRWAKQGIVKISGSEGIDFYLTKIKAKSYSEYEFQIENILISPYFEKISNQIKKCPGNASKAEFFRRVLDSHLMRIGGRT
jgi:hypothetical protein